MEAELDYNKSAQQNAEAYFDKAKEAKRKLEGAEQAIKRLEKQAADAESEKTTTKELRKKEEREWYEKFYWFFASDGKLAIGGRSAQQNEEVVSKYFDSNDLFFHANIFGASVVILKNGAAASAEVKEEAAQFAACFSKAWESGQSAVDVFSARKEQVSKSQAKGSLGTGSFLISGDRAWYRNVKLELAVQMSENRIDLQKQFDDTNAYVKVLPLTIIVDAKKLNVSPYIAYAASKVPGALKLQPGKTKKSDAAKTIAKRLGYNDIDYIMQHLPPGGFSVGN
ncbi:MAG: NFACT RNA binding domain-containing protein [Candidatus Marsarchaeota archaeon]|nr:NFACT RNA binding domain-containing protein [Candidatus Marsarchaeota archaeon]